MPFYRFFTHIGSIESFAYFSSTFDIFTEVAVYNCQSKIFSYSESVKYLNQYVWIHTTTTSAWSCL